MTQPLAKDKTTCAELAVAAEQTTAPLSVCVSRALADYFEQLEGHPAANLYEMLMTEVEVPLLKATLEHTNGNQSRAAEILGINRGTLRKKLKQYGL
ncbi:MULTISPECIES: DNA-binding transcriptional regulator Fis [Methylophaga]|jgi:Fis family transcriptional regulator|uniref:Putative Fis-like DNA-binding protein n=1 Tax=Methylophaga marina TaxID=45495 RepID=A0ABN0TYX1_9GAMM|nr:MULTISPECIES: DNA-binding transcriptional regulator Fis [Methylophaga]MAX50716.1 DNA-binding transcriptional regulator Fis [Methylophaga sp.]BDZ74018.1 DNA-binding protein Fis [Methylophaga marina]|tara:strand:- start:1139 stop:1429 length:291 start_codon:yes stop_codon:yes gene_type:complete